VRDNLIYVSNYNLDYFLDYLTKIPNIDIIIWDKDIILMTI